MFKKKFISIGILLFLLLQSGCNTIKKVWLAKKCSKIINHISTDYNYRKPISFIFKDNTMYLPCKINGKSDTIIFLSEASSVLNKNLYVPQDMPQKHIIHLKMKQRIANYNSEIVCSSKSCCELYRKTKRKGTYSIAYIPCEWETEACKQTSTIMTLSCENFGSDWMYYCHPNHHPFELGFGALDTPILQLCFSDTTIQFLDSINFSDTIDYKCFSCRFVGMEGEYDRCSDIPRINLNINEEEEIFYFNTSSKYFLSLPYTANISFSKQYEKITDTGLFGEITDTFAIIENPVFIENLCKTTLPIMYEQRTSRKELGMAFISHFDWIIDFKNEKIYAKLIRSFEEKNLNIQVYKVQIINSELEIISRPMSFMYPLKSRIKSVNGEKITTENICEYQTLLNQTNNWNEFDLIIEMPKIETNNNKNVKKNEKNKCLYIILLLIILNSCFQSPKFNYQEMDAVVFKNFIFKTKKSNKAIYFFEPTCGQCKKYLMKIYPEMKNKFGDSIDYFFVFFETTYKQNIKEYLEKCNVEHGNIIFIKNDINSNFFKCHNINLMELFSGCFDKKYFIDFIGIPTSIIMGKNNRLKIQPIQYNDSDSIYFRPMPWHDWLKESIHEHNFDNISNSVVLLEMKRPKQIFNSQ